MTQYLSAAEERSVRRLLDELAAEVGFVPSKKEPFFPGFYLDRLWYSEFGSELIPAVAFEIERGVPLNERLRKDILNIAWSRAPLGFLLVPHDRILRDPRCGKGSTAENWYANISQRAFEDYRRPFAFYCDVRLADIDRLLESRSLSPATIGSKAPNKRTQQRRHDRPERRC